jgi:hypothetical protein
MWANCSKAVRGVSCIGGWLDRLSCLATPRLAQSSPRFSTYFSTAFSLTLPVRVLQEAPVVNEIGVEIFLEEKRYDQWRSERFGHGQ